VAERLNRSRLSSTHLTVRCNVIGVPPEMAVLLCCSVELSPIHAFRHGTSTIATCCQVTAIVDERTELTTIAAVDVRPMTLASLSHRASITSVYSTMRAS